jgi:hypothetical protein
VSPASAAGRSGLGAPGKCDEAGIATLEPDHLRAAGDELGAQRKPENTRTRRILRELGSRRMVQYHKVSKGLGNGLQALAVDAACGLR